MLLLIINAGSSSIKLALYECTTKKICSKIEKHYDLKNQSIELILPRFFELIKCEEISAIAHRVVHGGPNFSQPCIIDNDVIRAINEATILAPLHNPNTLQAITYCKICFNNDIRQVAVFDTGFFSNLPDVSSHYPIPRELALEFNIQRYGFHGLAHQGMWQRWNELNNKDNKQRVISLQLGSGCSVSAILNGQVIDTSMGFSPMEGLMMSTRSGDLDPGIVFYLQKVGKFDHLAMERILNKKSGLLGVSGVSDDMRVLLNSNQAEAKLAIAMFCYRIRKYIGAYAAALGGLDTILFGGGIGENSPEIRHCVLENFQWLGIELDLAINTSIKAKCTKISKDISSIEAWVIPNKESTTIAAQAFQLLSGPSK